MDTKDYVHYDDISYFYKYLKGVRKIRQDTVFNKKKCKLHKERLMKRKIYNQELHSDFFDVKSNNNSYILNNPISYVRSDLFKSELKKLKNGKYTPYISIDLHGFNQYQSKQELGKLFSIYNKRVFFCFSIVHGHGQQILKYQIPIWLSRHPSIIAFHQAPKKFGYNAALLALIKSDI